MDDDLIRQLEQQKQELEALKAQLVQQNVLRTVIACLGKLHIAVYGIDLVTGIYREVSVITKIPRFSPCEGVFRECVGEICKYTVGADYRGAMHCFLDLDTMADRLRDRDTINILFQNCTDKWRQATIIANDRAADGRVLSVLYLTTDIDEFKRKEMEYQKALELSNKQKDDYLENMLKERQAKEAYYYRSRLDLMTGLYHKTAFFEEGQEYLDERAGQSVCVIFLDIDDFKKVNDRFGHQFGDKVINRVASVLRTSLANKDIICRYGGDEFCALLKDISKEKAVDKVQFLSEKLQLVFKNTEAHDMISCSIGAAYVGCTEAGCKIDSLVEQADMEAYKCKRSGKNCYSINI